MASPYTNLHSEMPHKKNEVFNSRPKKSIPETGNTVRKGQEKSAFTKTKVVKTDRNAYR